MKRQSSIAVVILAGVLVGFLLEVRTAGAANSVAVTGGSGTCGSGGGYEVTFVGTYNADSDPFGPPRYRTPVVLAECQTATNWGPYPEMRDTDATLDGTGGASVMIVMPDTVKRPPANPYITGWYVWFVLGYEEDGIRHYCLTSNPWYFIPHASCFAAGTPVLTPEGSRAIEQLRVGDLVLSSPEKGGDGQIEARCI